MFVLAGGQHWCVDCKAGNQNHKLEYRFGDRMDFTGDIGVLQRRLAECREGVERRKAVIRALEPKPGEHVIDLGCGAGHLVQEIAQMIQPSGRITGIDVSPQQLAVARERCKDLPSVEFLEEDAVDLPFPSGSFEKLASIQALEYIQEVDSTLAETRRLLKPGGIVALVSVLWDHWRFHGAEATLNDRILDAFRAHCIHQMLPLQLPEKLSAAGFENARRQSLAFFNDQMGESDYACWAAKAAAAFAVSQGVSEEDAKDWLSQLAAAENEGRFAFISVPILTTASVPK